MTNQAPHPWVAAKSAGVRFGVTMIGPAHDWGTLFDWAAAAEEYGFDAWFKADHPSRSMDCWEVLTALALKTKRLRLGSLVTCVYYRHPAVLARIAADVDRLSGGRLILGTGIGDDEVEFGQMGKRWPETPVRHAAHEEAIRIIRGAWSESPFSFAGTHFAVSAYNVPPPAQTPYVPHLIGGGGIRNTLGQVGRFADACNFGPHPWTGSVLTTDDVKRRLAALDEHCRAAGRDPSVVLRTHIVLPLVLARTPGEVRGKYREQTQGMVAGTPDQLVDYYRELRAAGMEYFIACIREGDRETFDLYGREVMPRVLGS